MAEGRGWPEERPKVRSDTPRLITRTRQQVFRQTNCDLTSILGLFIKMNSSRTSERQVMFFKAKQMLKKARQRKHGSHPTILSRWYEQEGYRKSLAKHNVGEKEVMLFDSITLEKHDYTASRDERLQNAKYWIFLGMMMGFKSPLRQRPEFAVASECHKNTRRSLGANAAVSETDTSRTSTT